jgi:hypothetical protein
MCAWCAVRAAQMALIKQTNLRTEHAACVATVIFTLLSVPTKHFPVPSGHMFWQLISDLPKIQRTVVVSRYHRRK